ncbi:hypothetical protein [Sulfurihydrogenibium subterraneum]|uniref:hypothetical protein n=1 Tax=Sulfurihydrogenibium subterraneum TaxID=171121 RepID=UPI00048F0A10|nr:hypothetical protein [Sulfurihydrogenibium subterraneum]
MTELHPPTVHFAIALTMMGVIFEILGFISNRESLKHAPAKKGTLKAIGKVLKIGKSVAFAVVEITFNDELVAYAT